MLAFFFIPSVFILIFIRVNTESVFRSNHKLAETHTFRRLRIKENDLKTVDSSFIGAHNFILAVLAFIAAALCLSQNTCGQANSIVYMKNGIYENNYCLNETFDNDTDYIVSTNFFRLPLIDEGIRLARIHTSPSINWEKYFLSSDGKLNSYSIDYGKDSAEHILCGKLTKPAGDELLIIEIDETDGTINNKYSYYIDVNGYPEYDSFDLVGTKAKWVEQAHSFFVSGFLVDTNEQKERCDKYIFFMRLDSTYEVDYSILLDSKWCCDDIGGPSPPRANCLPVSTQLSYDGGDCDSCYKFIYDAQGSDTLLDMDFGEDFEYLSNGNIFLTGGVNITKVIADPSGGGAGDGACDYYKYLDCGVLAVFLNDSCLEDNSCSVSSAMTDFSFSREDRTDGGHFNSGAKVLFDNNSDSLFVLSNSSKGEPFEVTVIEDATSATPSIAQSVKFDIDIDAISDDPIAAFDMEFSDIGFYRSIVIGGYFIETDSTSDTLSNHSPPFLLKYSLDDDSLHWFKWYSVPSSQYRYDANLSRTYYHPFYRYTHTQVGFNSPAISHDMMALNSFGYGFALVTPLHDSLGYPSPWDKAMLQLKLDGEYVSSTDCGDIWDDDPDHDEGDRYVHAYLTGTRVEIVRRNVNISTYNDQNALSSCRK